jgi:hypothetical protein
MRLAYYLIVATPVHIISHGAHSIHIRSPTEKDKLPDLLPTIVPPLPNVGIGEPSQGKEPLSSQTVLSHDPPISETQLNAGFGRGALRRSARPTTPWAYVSCTGWHFDHNIRPPNRFRAIARGRRHHDMQCDLTVHATVRSSTGEL